MRISPRHFDPNSRIDVRTAPELLVRETLAGLSYRETAERLGLNRRRVLHVLSMRIAAMASIEACAQPIKRRCERPPLDE
jgi:hypothetical protein